MNDSTDSQKDMNLLKLNYLLDKLQLEFPVADLSKKTGYSESTISPYLSGKVKPSTKFLQSISKAYNLDLTDFDDSNLNIVNEPSVDHNSKNKGTPIYDVDFNAGFVEIFKSDNIPVIGYLDIPELKGSDAVVRVKGDSMKGLFEDKDWIAIKKITDFEVMSYGSPYAIVTKDLQLLKYIFKSSVLDNFLLKSENPQHQEFDLPIKKILELYIITATIPVSKIKNFI